MQFRKYVMKTVKYGIQQALVKDDRLVHRNKTQEVEKMLAVFLHTENKHVLSLSTVQRICSLLCINIVLIHATKAIMRIIGTDSYSRLKKVILHWLP
jgi:hypothetical protein